MSRPADWPKGAWSDSRFRTLRTCPRKHHLKYGLKVYPSGPKAMALEVGSYVHKVLELVGMDYLAGRECDTEAYVRASAAAARECYDPKAALEGARLISKYREKRGDGAAGWGDFELLAVEKVLVAQDILPDHGGFAAIADAVVEDDDGLAIVERKTAGRMPSGTDESIIRELRTRPQLLGLAYCARDHYGFIPDVIYDLITKTKDVGFARWRLRFTEEELTDWVVELDEMSRMSQMTCRNLDACAPAAGFRCEYFNYCHGSPEDRATLYEESEH